MRAQGVSGLALLAALFSSGCIAPQRVVTTRSLLAEMTDLRRLAEYPDPDFRCSQSSSYDRRSVAPTQPEPPEEGWFANADFNHYIRVEEHDGRREYVMLDVDGPGAVVRIWSANPKGMLRVYLDHSPTPVLAVPMQDLLGGRVPGIPSPIAGQRSRGWNCYFPIPYARHCKITSDADGFYYHVNYRTYAPGTIVRSFRSDELKDLEQAVWATAGRLAAPRAGALPPPAGRRLHVPEVRDVRIASGQRVRPLRLRAEGALVGIEMRVRAADPVRALRQTVLLMDFDGERTVECPVGDFFGTAPGISAYESLPVGVTEDGLLWCQWWMPFQDTAAIYLHNSGEQEVTIDLNVEAVPYEWTDRSMHFHARWRTEYDVPTRPLRDWNYLVAQGRGVFVGTAFSIANPVRHWWGEGDEKICVDGEAFPSHFGTGTEDYFGYAWCSNRPFTHAYHAQPRADGPGNYGHTTNVRWHILDRIPFRRDIRFDMELWHWHAHARVTPAVTVYWYARPGATDAFRPLERADLELRLLPPYVVHRVPGAIEAEQMQIISRRAEVRVDPHLEEGASGDETLFYHAGAQRGDRLVLGFEVPKPGRYRIWGRFHKSRDFGIVQWSINDVPAAEPIDHYSPTSVLTEEIDLGAFELRAGQNRLAAEVIGANSAAAAPYWMFGLDYIRLEEMP
jgi:hypothetical protein